MIDPGTGLTILGTAIGSAKLAEKVLGPTADLAGTGLKEWTERRIATVKKIFERAGDLQGDKPIAGSVPPRVLRDVLNEGSLRDDELAVSYYGGILASSKTGVSRDDRGAYFTGLIDRLTSYQLRGHFVLYSMARKVFSAEDHNINEFVGRSACHTFVPLSAYLTAMQPEQGEDFETLVGHVLFGLQKEALIEANFTFGDAASLRKQWPEAPDTGLLFSPSALGVSLYLLATGNRDVPVNGFLKADLVVPDVGVQLADGSLRVQKLPETPSNVDSKVESAPGP